MARVAEPPICENAGVKQLVWVVLAAAVLVWAGVLLDLGDAPRAERASESREPGADSMPERMQSSAQPAPVQRDQPGAPEPMGKERASGLPAEQQARVKLQPAASSRPRGAVASPTPTQQAAQPAPVAPGTEPEGSGELGEGLLSPEFRELEQTYIHEPRDGTWAIEQEQRVRQLFRDQPLREQLVFVHCQQTLCRIVLQDSEPQLYERLLAVPGLREETGLEPQTPFSLRSGQLIVYFERSDERAR
jgi:hypothetical protein